MSRKKTVIVLVAFLLLFCTVNVQAQEEMILVLTKEVSVADTNFKVGPPYRVFSIGEDGVYLYVELKNLDKPLQLGIKVLNPFGEEVLNYEVNISSPREKGILRYPWVRGYLYIPIMGEENGFAFFQVYYYEKISEDLPENVRISMDGEWFFEIYRDGELVRSLKFVVRLLKLKVYILDSNGEPIDEAKARIVGDHVTSILDVYGGILEQDLRPGSYLLEVYKSNIAVYRSTINLTREDIEIQAICNVTNLVIRILDQRGVPVDKAEVILEGLDSVLEASTNETGSIIFESIPFHRYRVSVVKYGINVGEHEVTIDSPIAVYDLTVNVTDFCVKVVGEHRKPLPRSKVALIFPGITLTTLTGENGEAIFKQVPRGVWEVVINYKNLEERDRIPVEEDNCVEVKLPVFFEILDVTLSKEMLLIVILGLTTVVVLIIAAIVLRSRVMD